MAEQLAVDNIRGDRLAVEREQRSLGPQACTVDRAGEGFLAGTGFADDQHRQAVARRLGGDRKRRPELGRGADQLLERQRRRELFGNGRQLAGRTAAVGIGGKRFEQTFRRDRPDEKIGCSGAHGFDGDRNAVAVGKNDYRKVRAIVAQGGDQRRPLLGIPAAEQCRQYFAAVRPLQQSERHLVVGGADHAPARPSGDRGDQPAFLGDWHPAAIAIVSVLRASRALGPDPMRRAVKASLRPLPAQGLGSAGRLVMDAPKLTG